MRRMHPTQSMLNLLFLLLCQRMKRQVNTVMEVMAVGHLAVG